MANPAAARSYFEESLVICRELGDKRNTAIVLKNLAVLDIPQGDYGLARARQEESLANYKHLDDKQGISDMLSELGLVARYQGNYQQAVSLLKESLSLERELRDKRSIALCLERLAGVNCALGQPERAARLFGVAEVLREAIGAPVAASDRAGYECDVADVRAALDEAVFAREWAQGRTMTLEQALEYALGREDK